MHGRPQENCVHCYFRRRPPLKLRQRVRGVLLCRMDLRVYGEASRVVFGGWSELKSVVEQNADAFSDDIENDTETPVFLCLT